VTHFASPGMPLDAPGRDNFLMFDGPVTTAFL